MVPKIIRSMAVPERSWKIQRNIFFIFRGWPLIRSLSILLYTSSDILADLWYFLRRLSLIVTPHWWCQLTNQSEPQLAPLPTYWENSKKYYRTFCRNIAKYYYATPTPYIIQNLICVLNKNIFRLFFLTLLIFTPFNLKIVPANQIPFSFRLVQKLKITFERFFCVGDGSHWRKVFQDLLMVCEF